MRIKSSLGWLFVFIPITLALEHAGVPAPLVFFSAALAIVALKAGPGGGKGERQLRAVDRFSGGLCGLGVLGRPAMVALALAVAACGPVTEPPKPAPASGEWREFEGSWNAAGTRRAIPLGADRRGSIIDLRGTMLLAGPGRPGVGFHSEVIALVDSETGLVGRSVWTDERGDQVFSDLKGEGTAARNRIAGTILGGTGRYAGATGSYEFSWQFVTEAEDGSIQGRAVELKGRVRPGQPAAGGLPK